MPSVMMEVPFASVSSTLIRGCISVGKPGCGMVLIFSGSMSPVRETRTESSYSSTCAPAFSSLEVMGSRCFGITFLMSTLPPVMAAPTI